VLTGCGAAEPETARIDALERGAEIDSSETGIRMITSALSDGGCTATVVGPRMLLTAAHCVASLVPGKKEVLPGYRHGAEILVSKPGIRQGKWNDETAFDTFLVDRVSLSREWIGTNPAFYARKPSCKKVFGCENVLGHDVAFITTTGALGGIVVPVSTQSVNKPVALTLYGGGQVEFGGAFDAFFLKKGPSAARPREFWLTTQDKPSSYGDLGIAATALIDTGNFLLSASQYTGEAKTPNVLLGDSGGPVMAAGKVVGVNSMTGAVLYNIHASLSGRHATWVETTLCPASEKKRYDASTGFCKR
jgi:hypothetical protein